MLTSKGKVPSQVSVEEATRAAALCAANILRAVSLKLGSLDRVERARFALLDERPTIRHSDLLLLGWRALRWRGAACKS